MIPQFPAFKKLEITDRDEVEAITRNFPPYSDFNFTSMWVWDVTGRTALSRLHDNLVVRFADYLTGMPFYSFIGANKLNETAQVLLSHSEKEGTAPSLRLVPAEAATLLDPALFHIVEDPDNFDYCASAKEMSEHKGQKFMKKRNHIRKFKGKNNPSYALLNLADTAVCEKQRELFRKWSLFKEKNFNEHEFAAFERFLSMPKNDFSVGGVFVEDSLEAFWVTETVAPGFSISHFEKANSFAYPGIYQFLKQEHATVLVGKGIVQVNLEQDLGIPGLRENKSSYNSLFLKKYVVSLR